jgi:hypothetical protein
MTAIVLTQEDVRDLKARGAPAACIDELINDGEIVVLSEEGEGDGN